MGVGSTMGNPLDDTGGHFGWRVEIRIHCPILNTYKKVRPLFLKSITDKVCIDL